MKNLGTKIRSLRLAKDLTIVDMAKSTGIDQATLSRIENGKMTGTLQSHMRIADVLGVRLPQLYDDVLGETEAPKEEAARRRIETFSSSTGTATEILTGAILQKKLIPALIKLKPGGHTLTEEFKTGVERFIYVVSGDVEVSVGKEKARITKGESLYFDGSRTHHFSNRSKGPAQLLSVMTGSVYS